MNFELHPRLANGSFHLGRIAGSHLLLKNNALFPWFLLVPETDAEDLHELAPDHYTAVYEAIRQISIFVKEEFKPERLNVGYISLIVRQLHMHIVGRSSTDPAWPAGVWGFEGKELYTEAEVERIRAAARKALPLE
ncbi:MAG: family hydrolase, diadenosine tetraphosphate hydrolase [Akkermansiaceae bacterium]|nr:family hydrolase, diadenosine tetraphosphate hydrolase [Akkermansiaceae bacterium]